MRKSGFTLAEVLLVLAIIGIVSAMTIPSLMQDTQGKEYKVQLKKGISVLNQAVLRSVALENKDFSAVTSNPVTEILLPQLRSAENDAAVVTGCGTGGVILADGMVVTYDSTNARGCIDVNGAAKPNKVTTDATKPLDTYYITFSGDTVSCYSTSTNTVCKDVLRK